MIWWLVMLGIVFVLGLLAWGSARFAKALLQDDARFIPGVRVRVPTSPTPESIARAKADQQADRVRLERLTGIHVDEDGHITPRRQP